MYCNVLPCLTPVLLCLYIRLLEDLDDLDWADSIKDMQRNWIGRSEVRGMNACRMGLLGVTWVGSSFLCRPHMCLAPLSHACFLALASPCPSNKHTQGAEITFKVVPPAGSSLSADESLTVYTTRPDTLFGATYMVLAPEHPLLSKVGFC
jgi:leucyl-tRNA synthetase